MWVALFHMLQKLFYTDHHLKVAKEHNSKAIEAIAFDHKADIVASIAAAIRSVIIHSW